MNHKEDIFLSKEAKNELKEILKKEIGPDQVNILSDDEINKFGTFLLALRAQIFKNIN